MKLGLTDKQYNNLLSLLQEQAEPPPAEPEKGTSDKQAGGQGYPQVGKWESGVTRGPGNQIGITKWADVVGAKLNRGKANQLKEQEGRGDAITMDLEGKRRKEEEETKKKELFLKNNYIFEIPNGFNKTNTLVVPKRVNDNDTTYSKFMSDDNTKLRSYFGDYFNSDSKYDWVVPKASVMGELLPNGTLRSFTVNGNQYIAHLKRVSDKPLSYAFIGYLDKNQRTYQQSWYIDLNSAPENMRVDESFWGEWGQSILILGSFVVSLAIPGIGGLTIAMIMDLAAATDLFLKGDEIGGLIALVCGFLPILSTSLRIGRVSVEQASTLAKKLENCKNTEELTIAINGLSNRERYWLNAIKETDPNELVNLMDKVVREKMVNLNPLEVQKIVRQIKYLDATGKLTKSAKVKWYKTFAMEHVAFVGGSLIGLESVRFSLEFVKKYINEGDGPYNKYASQLMVDIDQLSNDIENINPYFSDEVDQLLTKYKDLSDDEFKDDEEVIKDLKYLTIVREIYHQYVMNPKNDNLEKVAKTKLEDVKNDFEKYIKK
jgi:hypothetical protein